MEKLDVILFFLMWGLTVVLGASIGHQRGQGFAGAILGLFLGPLGWLIAAFLPRSARAQAEHDLEVQRHCDSLTGRESQPTGPFPPTADPAVRPMFPDAIDLDEERFANWRRGEELK